MVCITIKEIDTEIKRLKELKEQKEKEALPEYKQYVGKLYRHTDGSIGKIIDAQFKDGKIKFKGKNLWFDDDYYSITNEEDIFELCDFSIILISRKNYTHVVYKRLKYKEFMDSSMCIILKKHYFLYTCFAR